MSRGRSSRRLHALRSWTRLAPRVRAKRLLLLADYDGTLVPIAATPHQARPTPGLRALLRRLAGRRGVCLGIVSGRALSDVRGMLGIPGIIYVGNHGLEMVGPGIRFLHPSARRSRSALAAIARRLREALREIPGAMVEPKRLTLSVHWRGVSAKRTARFRAVVRQVLAPWVRRRLIRLTTGKRVIDVRPPTSWDKGRAVTYLARRRGGAGAAGVVYLGDDRTDEDAFRAVNRLPGVSVFVGRSPRGTAAQWWVASPREAHRLLARMLRAG